MAKLQSFITEIRKFLGMRKDYSSSNVPENKYIDAENVRMTDKAAPFLGGLSLTTGNKFVVDLGNNTSNNYKGYRIAIDLTANVISHTLTINGTPYTAVTGTGTATARYNTFKTNIETATAGINGGIYVVNAISAAVIHVGFSFNGDWVLIETIATTPQTVQIISEYLADNITPYVILKTYNDGDNLFVLKTNDDVLAIDCEVKNEITGAWTKNTFFKSKSIKYSKSLTNIVDFAFELDFGEQCSFYISGTPPRAIYIKESQLAVANSAFIWNENPAYIETGNTYGYYTYENVEEETVLQVLENLATASFVSMQEGGALSAGDKMYCIRQLIGTTVATGFNIVSNTINVMSKGLSDTRISGNTGGYLTSKSITLQINNLNPSLYNKFDLAVIENIDGALTVKRVSTYPITGITQIITHYGTEQQSTNLTVADIVTQQVILLSVGNVVINRNRLFLSDVTLRKDRDFSSFFDISNGNVTITTATSTVPAIGKEHDNVAEYQLPQNVFNKIGYTLNETYRFATLVIEKDGWVNSPFFTADWTCTVGGGAALTNDVTTGVGYPTIVYVYHPQITIDYTSAPTINGQPFLSQISAISIVRQECVKEVLATGYVMPTVFENATQYSVGGFVNAPSYGIFDPNPTGLDLKKGALISPDVLFQNEEIVFENGDMLKVANTVNLYNDIERFPLEPLPKVFLMEYGSVVNTNFSNKVLTNSEEVPFNSVGSIPMNGKFLSTSVTSDFKTGCQQRMIAVETTTDIGTPTTPNSGFFYAQYFRPLTNKYGDKKGGTYFTCGHFQLANAVTVTGFAMDIYGGDTFIQKSITKFVNQNDFEIYDIEFDSTVPVFNFTVGNVWTYIVEASNGGGIICQTAQKSITISGGNAKKSHLLTYTPVIGATTYKIFFNISTAPANWYFYTSTTIDLYYLNVNLASFTPDTLPANPTTYSLSVGLSYYTENRNNYQMRFFPIGDHNSYPYITTDINVWLSPVTESLVEGVLDYSQSYTPIAPIQTFLGFDSTLPTDTIQPSILYYSEVKEDNSPHDAFRVVKPINFKSYTQYGRITNSFADVNSLILMCVDAILTQQLDQQQTQTDPNGTSIIIGDGTVLGTREVVSSYIGSPFKSSAVQYITKAGSYHTAWFNNYKNKVFRRGGDGVRVLSEENFMQTFFSNNNHFIANENDVILGWDDWSQEMLMRARATVTGEVTWNPSTSYSKGTIVKVGQPIGNGIGVLMYRYFKASIDVPNTIGSPLLVVNQMNYWEIYRDSNYLISFNESDNINDYSSFYGINCDNFIPYKDTFLTAISVDTPASNLSTGLFEHNINTLKYYSTGSSGGILVTGYVTQMFNKDFTVFKTLRNVWIQAQNLILTDIHFRGQNGTKTFSIQSEIVEKRPNEGAWWSNAKWDATIGGVIQSGGTNTIGSSDLDTQQVGGQTNTVTIFFTNNDNTVIGGLNEVLLEGVPKPTLNTQ